MERIYLDNLRAEPVPVPEDAIVVVKNLGATVYYKDSPGVSATNKTGELAENAELTIYADTWFLPSAPGTALTYDIRPDTAEVDSYVGGNLAVGQGALGTLTGQSTAEQEAHGSGNTAFGFRALANFILGRRDSSPNFSSRNTAVGSEALAANDKGVYNVAIGAKVLALLKIGSATATEEEEAGVEISEAEPEADLTSGSKVLKNVTSFTNVAIGQELTAAGKLTAGTKVLEWDSTAKTITADKAALGTEAKVKVKVKGGSGYAAGFNTAIGQACGESLVLGQHNVLVGSAVLRDAPKGSQNTCVGCNTLERATGKVVNITAVGISALEQLEGGASDNNTEAIGANAAARLKHIKRSVIIGTEAHRNGESSSEDIAIGRTTLGGGAAETHEGATSANVAVGNGALGKMTEGEKNTALGYNALNTSTTSANTAVGYKALSGTTTGTKNVVLGKEAGQSNQTGAESTYIGTEAGEKTTGSGNIFIGYHAGQNEAGVSNTLIISNSATTTNAWIRGEESGKKLGFFGVAPVLKQTANAPAGETAAQLKTAIEELRTALKNLGLIT